MGLAAVLLVGGCSGTSTPKRKDKPIPTAALIPFKSTGNDLRDAAEYATDRILAADKNTDVAQTYALVALARATYYGWKDAKVKALIQQVEQRRNPDGGFGLGQESDTFGDGTFNPADDTYTITSTDHVGRLYLAAYRAGAIPKEWLVKLVDAVIKLPRIKDGTCVAYSMSKYDAVGPCVYNVVAGVAWFLTEARKAGIDRPGQDQLTAAMAATNKQKLDTATGLWPYQSTSKPGVLQDEPHNGTNMDALAVTDPALAKAATQKRIAQWQKHHNLAPFAIARVSVYDCAGLAGLGPYLVKEVQLPPARTNTRTLAQMAAFDARADAVCTMHRPVF
ncbi:hypothetical protein [Fodinicola acaciae]|uniref:hypothetical protein n=1 Tax=Fodinicola acaciae TaxID=2681555 RepID=UPI0013D3B78C|nr:hypothetical protein [Fodinicola acaciae]